MRIVRIALRNILVGLFCTFAVQSLFAQKTSMTLKDGKISYNVDDKTIEFLISPIVDIVVQRKIYQRCLIK